MFRHKKSARKGEFPSLQRGGLNILLLPEMLLFSVRRGEDSVHRDEGSVHRGEDSVHRAEKAVRTKKRKIWTKSRWIQWLLKIKQFVL